MRRGKQIASRYSNWKLVEIETSTILNYTGSALETSGPLVEKINNFFIRGMKNLNDLPPIVLIPVDRDNPHPFIEHKYGDEVKWEAADGIHRLHCFLKFGMKKIKGYVPCED